jgi:hypothetical protein
MKFAALLLLILVPLSQADSPGYFIPKHQVSGIGVGRDDLSGDQLSARTNLMIESQTFGIMRDARALDGAKRTTGDPRLQALFRSSAEHNGLPVSILEAIAYLESWGDAKAESPSGPRGIMQISAATARGMGLKVFQTKRYKVTRERVPIKSASGKPRFRTVTRRTPYMVVSHDDRLVPARAIPAAAHYLAGLVQRFGGLDWAIFAYHCGQGCVTEMQELTRRSRGIPKEEITVARMFFACNPAWNRELYQAIQQQMQRDYSPTYYFRVRRAEQLLAMYRRAPEEFRNVWQEYRTQLGNDPRAPQRLSVWLKRDDLIFHSGDDIRNDGGTRLTRAFNRPEYFGYRLNIQADTPENIDLLSADTPAALGTLAYISFEVRRLMQEMHPRDQEFQPLEVVSLVEPEDFARQKAQPEALMHCSGQVFDIAYGGLPPAELEALRFVLDDLGWNGYLGFVEEGRDNLHIGCSPTSREFFTAIYHEALAGQAGATAKVQ